MSENTAVLIIADSEKDSNLYYATGFLAPDPFVYIGINGHKILVMSDLELDRARSQARVQEAISSSERIEKLKKNGAARPGMLDIIEDILKEKKISNLVVPGNFPIEYADPLRQKGFHISFRRAPFFEERMLKSEMEIQAIRQAQRATEKAVKEAIDMISHSDIKGDTLYYESEILTSEKIKEVLHLSMMKEGCIGEHTIVACGIQGVDPHNEGSGPLKANQSIILDVFPRSSKTRYFADMTRTVVRGKASDKLKRMYDAVLQGQEIGFEMIKDGVDGKSVHQAIQNYFVSLGFETGQQGGRFQGFFHGTGHGVGLDIHEPPRVSTESNILKAGEVVTVEPGLYYLDAGGIRLEDMVVVTHGKPVNLTEFSKTLEV